MAPKNLAHPKTLAPKNLARKLVEVFEVTVDFLVSDQELPRALTDPAMLERWSTLDRLKDEDRDRILFVVDGLIRDCQTRQAYAAPLA